VQWLCRAEARALQKYTTIAAISSEVANRLSSGDGRIERKNSFSARLSGLSAH